MYMSALSFREREPLFHLAVYRYLSRTQIEEFLFERSALTAASRQVITKRILRRLVALGLLEAQRRPTAELGGGTVRVAYSLTRAGYTAARALDPRLPVWRGAARSTVSISHSLVKGDVALAIRRAARTNVGQEVIEWELERRAAARLGSSSLVPDAFLIYATPVCDLHACVEVDLDTERPGIFAEKIRQYLDLYRSGSWQSSVRAWPVVVTITRTDGRARLLQRTAQTILSTAPDADRLGTQTEFDFAPLHDFLGPAGPFGAIWRVAGRDGLHPLIPLSSVSEDSSGSARKERVPTSRTDGQRCVYVIELDDVEQPRTTPLPCVYVGQSAQPAEVRFAQHKAGYKSSRFARRFGKHLRPDLSEHVKCTSDWQTALGREAALAAELRRAGHCVHGGH